MGLSRASALLQMAVIPGRSAGLLHSALLALPCQNRKR